ncbi:MAG: PQQ-binding-like beta-propeller repeat protein [Ignavibacteriae bacterium]|nr:PQQ-binding-like beta-propeller repeat protein [Ignavibacteriota bacterium]
MRKYLSIIFIIIFLIGCARAIQFNKYNENSEIISQYGSSPNRNFYINKKIEILKNPIWEKSTYGSYSNYPFSAYDTVLFVSDLGGRITALNLVSGKKLGEIKYKGGIEQTPIIDKSIMIFVVNEEKENYSSLVVYDLLKAKEFYKVKLEGKVTNELIFQNEKIFILTNFGKLYKFSRMGIKEWDINLKEKFYSDPAADEENLYACSIFGNLFSIQLNDGKVNYKIKICEEVQSGITMNESSIFFGDENGNVFSIDKKSAKIIWEFKTNFKIKTAPTIDNNSVYIGNLNGDLFSLNLINGNQNWKLETNGLINSTSLVFENILIQPNMNMDVDFIDKTTGEIIDKIQFEGRCRTSPFFVKDKIIFGIDKDDVFCFSVKEN